MTTIHNLPEEILLIIFGNLYTDDLEQVQTVCRAWYFPAHITLLKEIQLCTSLDIQQFIASIDYNPNPKYLKAVKSISIEYEDDEATVQFDREKLFFRFPNLQDVFVCRYSILFRDFNDQVCQDFIKHCPNIKRFEVIPADADPVQAYELAHKIRLLLTMIDVKELTSLVSEEKSLVDYIAEFPRVQWLYEESDLFDNFQAILPVFDQLQHIQTFNVKSTRDDQLDFVERYLATRPNEQQQLILKRLSKVEELSWKFEGNLYLHSSKFLATYLTGLDSFSISSTFSQSWNSTQQQTFCKNILHLLCSVKRHSALEFNKIDLSTLSECFSDIMRKVFAQAPSNHKKSTNRVLKLNLKDILEPGIYVYFSMVIDHADFTRTITVSSPNLRCFQHLIEDMAEQAILLDDADEFILDLPQKNHAMVVSTYYEILKTMPFLTKVTLDIPKAFEEDLEPLTFVSTQTYGYSHPMVQKLTLKAIHCKTKFQSLLCVFSFMFPHLKELSLERFCGDWEEGTQEYQIKLAKYSLESLTVDVTRIIIEIDIKQRKDSFFVVDVDCLHDAERFTYKVLIDTWSVTRVNQGELKGLTCGEDYFRVRIIVKSLQKLALCIDNYDSVSQYLENLIPAWSKRAKQAFIMLNDE